MKGSVNVPGVSGVELAKVKTIAENAASAAQSAGGSAEALQQALSSHTGAFNPHNVTPAQIGAAASSHSHSNYLLNTNWDTGTTTPSGTSPIRYNGYFRAARVYGMYYSDNADYAEAYPVDAECAPGDLIAIGASGYRVNDIAENTCVLGIVSTAPAGVIGGEGIPIALTGRVPVKAVGQVRAGDFLVGSSVPGAVMTATENPPRGAIVAQALEEKKSDEIGFVLAKVVRL
ncbi:MAG: hypothetical protein HFF18_04220 [Oscillospiraceae bacterium]|nr:hypothetical protein [Oscillospiraceae bacterium]